MAASTAAPSGHAVAIEVAGVRYPSARQAAQALGMSVSSVQQRAHSPNFPTFRWLGATPGPRELTPEDRLIARPLTEPERWPNDGGARRAPVMDPNYDPPRLVRRVGWLHCMCCGRSHFSEDVARARMCQECGGAGGTPTGPRPDWDA